MMNISFSTDNAAFWYDDDCAEFNGGEVARILRAIADYVEMGVSDGNTEKNIRDANGNKIGTWNLDI